jgi:Flp pilus assembly pilin Flp
MKNENVPEEPYSKIERAVLRSTLLALLLIAAIKVVVAEILSIFH